MMDRVAMYRRKGINTRNSNLFFVVMDKRYSRIVILRNMKYIPMPPF